MFFIAKVEEEKKESKIEVEKMTSIRKYFSLLTYCVMTTCAFRN